MSKDCFRKLSIASCGTRCQFPIGLVLVSLLPILLLIYVQYCNLSDKALVFSYSQLLALAFAFTAAIAGYLLLRKYPASIRRLRGCMERIVHGELPDKVSLLGAEDDITVVENSMNMILNTMKERESALHMETHGLTKQLYEVQKLESIGRLAGQVAHEFNNLLMAISGYSDLVLNAIGKDNAIRDDVIQIRMACTRAGNLVKQLLAFGRKQSLQQRPQNLNMLIFDMEHMLRTLMGESIELVFSLDKDLPLVNIDAGQIQQVLMNLITNAKDAMPGGGRLLIKTENVVVEESLVKAIPEATLGTFVRLVVEDHGTGMDKFTLARLFEPFFTTKKDKGTGLGLATAHGIIKQHGGWINVYSEFGHGSTFKIYLPVATAAEPLAASEEEHAVSVGSTYARGEQVLLVEDDSQVRSFAVKALRSHGYKVLEASDSETAFKLFESVNREVDLVFADVVLPGSMTGLALVEKLLALRPEMKVLLCSGYTDEKAHWPIIRDKHFKFLRKPYPMIDMLTTIREIVEKKPDSSPQRSVGAPV